MNPFDEDYGLECVGMATKIKNIVVRQNKKVPAYKLFHGVDAPYASIFAPLERLELYMMHRESTLSWKIGFKGCLFVGYANNHGEGIYRMFNLKTQ